VGKARRKCPIDLTDALPERRGCPHVLTGVRKEFQWKEVHSVIDLTLLKDSEQAGYKRAGARKGSDILSDAGAGRCRGGITFPPGKDEWRPKSRGLGRTEICE